MRVVDLTYSPKEQSISYMEVGRKSGYVSEVIHMHDHGEIVLVTSRARCQLTNNGNAVEIRTPAIWINRAGSFHEVTEVSDGTYESRIIFFHPQSLAQVPEEMRYEEQLHGADLLILPLSEEQVQGFIPFFDLLKERPLPQKQLMLLAVLSEMARLMESGISPITATAKHTYIYQVIDSLRGTEEKLTIPELAQRFHVSQTKLKQDFKAVTGITIKSFQTQARLQKACALLETTGLDQAAIACACGFCDESHFIERFRKVHGVTPGVYRGKVKNMEAIKDHNPKYLLSMDYVPLTSYNGIKHMNVLEWLLK